MADGIQTQDTTRTLAEIPEDLVRDAGRGVENIGTEDVRPPRLLICQAGSPQRKPDDPKQIAGLQELDMFNDLSGDIYGRGPLNFAVISSLGHRHIEFAPMDEGGGVIDFDVPDDDPRAQFTTDDEGKRVKPVATKFYDYLIWLIERQELVAFSLKSTQIKTAIKLNGLLKLPLKIEGRIFMNPPAWARTYTISTKMEKDKEYSWGGYNLSTVGITDVDTREMCKLLADTYAKANVIIERDAPEADAAGGEATGTGEPSDM